MKGSRAEEMNSGRICRGTAKRLLSAILVLLMIPVPSAFAYTSLSQDEAREMMSEAVIVDVRTPEEYDAGHIPEAICIPVESITAKPEKLPEPDQLLLIYCRSGRRSKQAAEKLDELGYRRVYEFGGIQDWTGEVVTTARDLAAKLLTDDKTDEAVQLLEEAAGDGDTSAMVLLGDFYLSSVPPAYEKAGLQYRRAGDNGNSVGYYKLAEMYEKGLLTTGNPCTDDLETLEKEKALEYYEKSAEMGNEPARLRLTEQQEK